jgi:uncharacterized membrane protein
MNNSMNAPMSLDETPADRDLVEDLFFRGVLTPEARDRALSVVAPHPEWALWAARTLTAAGAALVLSGVIYFFAYNWAKLTAFMKLGSIELAMTACLAGAIYLGLARLSGQMLLLSASVLVGVFWAVFGQIYQTGADAYVLFLAWSAMIFGFALIGAFAPLWALWLAVTNAFIILYWLQAAAPAPQSQYHIFSIVALFNLAFLALREVFAAKGAQWLSSRWTRGTLVLAIAGAGAPPMTMAILLDGREVTVSMTQAAMIGFGVLAAFFWFYRYKAPDMFALGVTVLTASVAAECGVYKIVEQAYGVHNGAEAFFTLAIATMALFATLVAFLRGAGKGREGADVGRNG